MTTLYVKLLSQDWPEEPGSEEEAPSEESDGEPDQAQTLMEVSTSVITQCKSCDHLRGIG